MEGDTSNPKRGKHFKPEDTDPNDPTKIAHIIRGRHFKPPHLETNNLVEALNRSTQQTLAEEDEVFKQLQKTQANISLWGLLMASYRHGQNLVNLLNRIRVPTTTTSQDLNVMIGSINRELTISYLDKDLTKKGKHHNNPLHVTVDAMGVRLKFINHLIGFIPCQIFLYFCN